MFQAILCDDNEIILEGLSSQIKWKDLGIELTATAADGNEAWELIQKNPPDLLITDIRMPYMDGLELSKKAQELNPNIVILIISAYDDFQYARTAMHLQAFDYILKPIDVDQFCRVLENAVLHCSQLHYDKRLMITEYLRGIALQDAPDLPAPGPDLDLDPGSYCCALHITIDEESLRRRSNDIRYGEEQKFSAFSTSLCQPGCYLLDSRHNSYTLALLSGSKLELITLRKILIDSVRKIFPYDGQNSDVIIASGNLCHRLDHLNQSMKSAAEALKLHFIKGTNSDIFYEEVVSYIGKEADPSPKLPLSSTTLISLIKKQDKKGLERELLQLKESLRQCGRESYLYMTFSISRLYTDLANELGSSGIELQDVFDNPMEEFKKVASSTTLEESIENLKQNLFKIIDSLNVRKSKYGKQVEQAIDHIKHHYSESTLSIEDVARTVCLSTSYFSTIFKNETGITFTDYLIKIRMERAKNLLENTHMKMYEISSMTGYENAAYFSAAFKRYFGKSPSDVQNHR